MRYALIAAFLLSSFSVFGFSEKHKKPWTYIDGGLRDPFTFIKVEWPPKGPVGPQEKEDLELILAGNLPGARKAFLQRQFQVVISICDKCLDKIDGAHITRRTARIYKAREQIYLLRDAAERLLRRKTADVAFRNLKLKLSGVVSCKRQSTVIINGLVAERGELVTAGTDEKAVVERILPGRVLLRFRGFVMELAIQ